jgi:hypothetical protein
LFQESIVTFAYAGVLLTIFHLFSLDLVPEDRTAMSPYTLFYWGACKTFYGRALPIVLALEIAQQEYEIKEPSDAPGSDCFAVPMLTFPNDVTMSQLPSILMMLGEKHGLAGSTEEHKMKVAQYLGDLTDIFSEHGKFKEEKVERGEKWFALLESRLTATGFFIGDSISVVDLYTHFVLLWIVSKEIPFDKFPALTKFNAMMAAHDAVEKVAATGVKCVP